MSRSYTPTPADPAPVWGPWVARWQSADERRKCMAQVPDALQERVARYVISVFELKAAHKRRQAKMGY